MVVSIQEMRDKIQKVVLCLRIRISQFFEPEILQGGIRSIDERFSSRAIGERVKEVLNI